MMLVWFWIRLLPLPQMQINKDRTWKYRRASLRPHIHHHQLSHVTLNYSLLLVVCVLMLPMLVVAVEHMQLATTYRMNPLDRCSLMTFIRTPLVLPSLMVTPPLNTLSKIDPSLKSYHCLDH